MHTNNISISKVLSQTQIELNKEKTTIVHCCFDLSGGRLYRIWPETKLIQNNGVKKGLLHAFNIAIAPQISFAEGAGKQVHFTLYFEGLDRDCLSFNLSEDIPEPCGFYSEIISKNTTDVYNLDILIKQ